MRSDGRRGEALTFIQERFDWTWRQKVRNFIANTYLLLDSQGLMVKGAGQVTVPTERLQLTPLRRRSIMEEKPGAVEVELVPQVLISTDCSNQPSLGKTIS